MLSASVLASSLLSEDLSIVMFSSGYRDAMYSVIQKSHEDNTNQQRFIRKSADNKNWGSGASSLALTPRSFGASLSLHICLVLFFAFDLIRAQESVV